MNKTLTALLAFAGGAGIGSLVTWIFAKNKYQKLVNEAVIKVHETADVREESEKEQEAVVEEQNNEPEHEEVIIHSLETVKTEPGKLENDLQKKAAEVAREKPNIIDYTKMIKELKYIPTPEANEDEFYSEYPYLITDDMTPFGEKEDSEGNPYDTITLIYYEDGVIADTTDEIIDDVNNVIGTDSLAHFGDFPNKDSIYVRNDRLRADFEVCMSALSWEDDVLVRKPYLREQ